MKNVVIAFVLFASIATTKAFATAGAEYQCGEYSVSLSGPDFTTVYDGKGEEVMHASLEEFSPLVIKKNKTVLRLSEREIACKIKSENN